MILNSIKYSKIDNKKVKLDLININALIRYKKNSIFKCFRNLILTFNYKNRIRRLK